MKNEWKVELLIKLLFDNDASITERDEAAMDLGEFSDSRTIAALLSKAMDVKENELVLNSCGESLGIIWAKQNFFDEKAYHALPGIVRYGAYVVIKSRKSEWIEHYHLEEDTFEE